MYIKEIKINGFKSFADKVNLELNKFSTGIVGPNGSGKSNIVDALKWVMGEQSIKSLRGTNNMTDVIFNGSASRPPARFASVSLVLDNTDKSLPLDYNEIEIKRIVYKTNENEYYINKEKVRLKDITDLFLDSFSSKESLSIIPQGKVIEILNGKPEDRRGIFEDAAGVLKYKKRKEETLKKLEKTNENMERIDMIINELEDQLSPLEEQANKAKIYKENKEKLENIEVALLAKDISSLNEEYILTKKEKETLSNTLIETTNKDTKEKVDLEVLKVKRSKLDNEITEVQLELMKKTEELNELNSKKELLKERSKYDKNSTEIINKLTNLKEEKLKIKNEYEKGSQNYKTLLEEKETLEKKLETITTEWNNLSKELNLLTAELNDLTRKKYELNSKKDILEYNIENMSKIPFAVKSILNNPSLNGIISRIEDLITVKEEYSAAINTALGASLNFIVTKTDADAKEAVEYLKRTKKGRVTFFPLNLIKPKSIDPSTLEIIKSSPGFVNIASKLVTYNEEYYNVIMNTLGNIVVSSSLDEALKISKKIASRYRIVTLEGDIINVGGSLTGGSKDNNSRLNEKTELDQITKNLKIIEQELNNKNETIKEKNYNQDILKNNIYNLNLEIVKQNETINQKQETLNITKQTLENLTEEIKSLDNNNEKTTELDQITKEYYKEEEKKNNLDIKVNTLNKTRKEIIEEIEALENIIKKYDKENKELTEKVNNLEIKETRLNMNLDALLNRLSEEYNMTFEKARNEYTLEIEDTEARNIITDLKRTIKSLGEVNLSSIEEYNRINKRFTFLNTQKTDLKESEENLLNIIQEMDECMKEKFSTTFSKINIEFGNVFKSLFNGGEAHLELTDPSDLLNTGVEIIANPAGKQVRALTQLSGGEMTLTAISLLFAIMNLKNVPFVVLDEVESALDEENVAKFGKYINSYRGKTQFLTITHKKETMSYLDLLYGVTMQESGVSKLVSVKLEEIKK